MGEVVLYALPPESDLTNWTASGRVSFAWGPKTLDGLEASCTGKERTPVWLSPSMALKSYDSFSALIALAFLWQCRHPQREARRGSR